MAPPTLKTAKSAPVTPVAAASSTPDAAPPKPELFSKLSEKSPVLGAVLTTVLATNPAMKAARGCMGPSCAGFRDWLLRGTVVDMAVAIVLGLAFIELIKAFISCLVTPLFAAIWKKDRKFADMKWVLRGSEFAIGKFINTFLAFALVCLLLYYFIVLPMVHLQAVANPKESRQPCPKDRMDADVTGEIQAELEDVQNNTPSYFNFRSWMPGRT